MSGRSEYQYATLRAVPRVERGERLNVGVVLHAPTEDFLAARVHLDAARLKVLDPEADVGSIQRRLDAVIAIAAGRPEGGPIARLGRSARFHWLVSPASTVIQPSEVHTGLCQNPDATLERLFRRLVR